MPPSSLYWETKDMTSLQGKIVIVTGANTGLGFATSLELVRGGAHVILACRNETRGLEAEQRIRADVAKPKDDAASTDGDHRPAPGVAQFMLLDVGSLASIRAFAETFKAAFDRLDILINNAGMKAVNHSTTVDGFEAQFGINHLGHFALTSLLFDALRKSPAARVVSIGSISHHNCDVDFDNLNAAPPKYDAMTAYRISKLANILFAYELQRRLEAAGITNVVSIACHPGVTESNLLPNLLETYNSTIIRSVIKFVHSLPWAQSNAMGALCILCAATDPQVVPGEYIGPHGFWEFYGYPRVVPSSKQSNSLENAARLWDDSEKLTNVPFPVISNNQKNAL